MGRSSLPESAYNLEGLFLFLKTLCFFLKIPQNSPSNFYQRFLFSDFHTIPVSIHNFFQFSRALYFGLQLAIQDHLNKIFSNHQFLDELRCLLIEFA